MVTRRPLAWNLYPGGAICGDILLPEVFLCISFYDLFSLILIYTFTLTKVIS